MLANSLSESLEDIVVMEDREDMRDGIDDVASWVEVRLDGT